MTIFRYYSVLFIAILIALPLSAANWPGWRGDGSGISSETHLPVAWTATQNVVWKVTLPGEGNSSPIVWGDRVFLTASADGGKQRSVLCLDAKDGHLLWKRDVAANRTPATDAKNGYASPTPVTDGTRVFAFFDSPGVVALDWDGNVLWTRELGPFDNPYNMAESPILYRDMVIMNCDHNKGSFIVALDKATGNERWRTPRAITYHFATPIMMAVNGKDQIITNGNIVIAHDALTGKEIWRCKGMTPVVTPSPVAADGLVYATSGRNGPTLAIDPSGTGDVSDTHVRMRATSGGPYVPSPLVYPYMMLPGDNGTLRVLNKSGKTLLDFRAPGHYTSSPVAGDGKMYWATEKGDVYVIGVSGDNENNFSLKLLAKNALGEPCLASPAISGGRLYLRTTKSLFCIAGQEQAHPVVAQQVVATFEELSKRFADHPAPEGPDVAVRIEVVEAFGQMRETRAIPLLLEAALRDKHWDVGEAAAKSLAQIGAPAIPSLITMLDTSKSWQPYLKVIPAQALGRLLAVDAVPALLKGSNERDVLVRAECLRALGTITAQHHDRLPVVLPALTGGMHHPDGVVREAAANALEMQRDADGADRDTMIAALLDGIADRNPLVVRTARQGLDNMHVNESIIKRDEILYGEQRKTSTTRALRAGRIRVKYQDGELRYLYVGNKEIIRRVYFAVRDSRWDTVAPEITAVDIKQQDDAFAIKLSAVCRNDVADFQWNGEIIGSADGKITFTVNGQANTDFRSPRVGLCVLFGAASLGGQHYELLDEKGTATAGAFPTMVTTDMLAKLNSFRTLRYDTDEKISVSVNLRDQSFGMEDQRMYGDSSYKAMSGMAYSYPNIEKGKGGNQVLTIEVGGEENEADLASPIRVALREPVIGSKLPKLVPPADPPNKSTFATYKSDLIKAVQLNPIVLSYCPALHLSDDDMLMENIPAIADCVRTLRASLPAARFRVDPITINSPYPRPSTDPRKRGLFTAAWSVRMLKYLGLAGVDEVAFAVGPGYATTIQQRIGAYASKTLLAADITPQETTPVDALAITANGKRIVWLANLTDVKREVVLSGCAPAATARVAVTDASWNPVAGTMLPVKTVRIQGDTLPVTLDAFAVCEVVL